MGICVWPGAGLIHKTAIAAIKDDFMSVRINLHKLWDGPISRRVASGCSESSRDVHRSNNNKMSCRERGRAPLQVDGLNGKLDNTAARGRLHSLGLGIRLFIINVF